MPNKMLLGDLDWKKSKLYTEFVIEKKNPKHTFEGDIKVFKEDEVDYIK